MLSSVCSCVCVFVCLCARVRLPHMDEVFVSATDDVVVGDGDGVDAAPAGLQHVNTLQRPNVPNLKERRREMPVGKKTVQKRKRRMMSMYFGKGKISTHTHKLSAVEKICCSTAASS